jgi:NADPH:quinone reductase-like Zn-dependent oxidoreductase
LGAEHVIVTSEGFTDTLSVLSAELGTTAVFDGVGGDLLTRIAPGLPMNSTIYLYGFLGGAVPISIQSVLFIMKNLTLRRFSNFESRTVKDHDKLVTALKALEGVIDDRMFTTRIGKEFRLDQVELAMAYESLDGTKAVLLT